MSKVSVVNIKFNKTVDCVTGKDNKKIQFLAGETYALRDEPSNWPLRWLKRGHELVDNKAKALEDPRFFKKTKKELEKERLEEEKRLEAELLEEEERLEKERLEEEAKLNSSKNAKVVK